MKERKIHYQFLVLDENERCELITAKGRKNKNNNNKSHPFLFDQSEVL
jgi:hypothetical protein